MRFGIFFVVITLVSSAFANEMSAIRCQSRGNSLGALELDMLLYTPGSGGYFSLNIKNKEMNQVTKFNNMELDYIHCASRLISSITNGAIPTIYMTCSNREDQSSDKPLSLAYIHYDVEVGSEGIKDGYFQYRGQRIPELDKKSSHLNCTVVDYNQVKGEFKRNLE